MNIKMNMNPFSFIILAHFVDLSTSEQVPRSFTFQQHGDRTIRSQQPEFTIPDCEPCSKLTKVASVFGLIFWVILFLVIGFVAILVLLVIVPYVFKRLVDFGRRIVRGAKNAITSMITSLMGGLKSFRDWLGIWILVLPKGIFNMSKVLFGFIFKSRRKRKIFVEGLDKDLEASSTEMTTRKNQSSVSS